MPGVVASAGDYTVELDTTLLEDQFILNTSLLNGTDVLDGLPFFTDITDFVTGIDYKRGRSTPFDQFGAGTMSFTLNDELAGGLLNPFDTTSIYYDAAKSQPGLAPMRRVRIFRDTTPLFNGVVETYNYQYELDRQNMITVNCIDDFWLLANTFMAAFDPSAETSGQRITTVLALPEVDYLGPTSIAAGTVNLGHSAAYDVAAGTNVLEYLQQINNTAEFGRLYMSANGTLTFQQRTGQFNPSFAAVFSDQGTDFKYRNVQIEFDARQVVNRAVVTGLNGHTEIVENLPSQTTYFVQTRDIGQSLLHLPAEIAVAATDLLQPQPKPRLTALTVNLAMLTNLQRDTVAAIDIGDTISITVTVPNLGIITEAASVEGIDGEIRLDGGHTLTFYTANTTVKTDLILGNNTFGVLNSTNVLG